MVDNLIEAAPNWRWRLIIALSRFGGLRVPSELSRLTWADIDWDKSRLWIRSPKTERQGKPGRWLPIFPELRPFLEDAFEVAEAGVVNVLANLDASNNLRTGLLRIIKRTGLTPWPRLFHNMRASRQTELTGVFPAHVVRAWIGNTEKVAEDHYLQVRDSDFERATRSVCVPFCVPRSDKPDKNTSVRAGASDEPITENHEDDENRLVRVCAPNDRPTTPKGSRIFCRF